MNKVELKNSYINIKNFQLLNEKVQGEIKDLLFIIMDHGETERGRLEVLQFLAEKGVNLHGENEKILRWVAQEGYLTCVQFLVKNGADIHAENDDAVHCASESGHLKVVKFLVENGADIHADNDSCVQWATRNGYLEVVKYLVENGARVNSKTLDWAIINKHFEIVEYLRDLQPDKSRVQDCLNKIKNLEAELRVQRDRLERLKKKLVR